MTTPTSIPYGLCPFCGAPGVTRERRPNGNDTCAHGHTYPSKDSVGEKRVTPPTPTGIEEMKREHDALILKGRPLMDELEAMTVRVNEIRKLIEEADPDEYDGVRLLFAGTFYD